MITRTSYKDRAAVAVESDALRATFLPDDGAKMASLMDLSTGRELLLTRDAPSYRVLTEEGSYVDSECSAFDDMFPTIDPYTPDKGAYKGVTYPDHGECCRLPHESRIEDGALILSARSRLFPISYEKRVTAAADGSIDIDYAITNEGDSPFDFIWAGHIMLKGEDGMRILSPFGENSPTETVFAVNTDDSDTLPRDTLTGFVPFSGAAYKFYYLDPLPEGYFGVRYADGRELLFRFDEKKLPYLGIWFNNGEFQGIYNVAPEPCTAPFDAPDRAAQKGYSSYLAANSTFNFRIKVSVRSKLENQGEQLCVKKL